MFGKNRKILKQIRKDLKLVKLSQAKILIMLSNKQKAENKVEFSYTDPEAIMLQEVRDQMGLKTDEELAEE